MSSSNGNLVEVSGVTQYFRRGSEEIHVLEGLDLNGGSHTLTRSDFPTVPTGIDVASSANLDMSRTVTML